MYNFCNVFETYAKTLKYKLRQIANCYFSSKNLDKIAKQSFFSTKMVAAFFGANH